LFREKTLSPETIKRSLLQTKLQGETKRRIYSAVETTTIVEVCLTANYSRVGMINRDRGRSAVKQRQPQQQFDFGWIMTILVWYLSPLSLSFSLSFSHLYLTSQKLTAATTI
jgi:hypothetical protein